MKKLTPKIISEIDHKDGFIYYIVLYPNGDVWKYKLNVGHKQDVDDLRRYSEGRAVNYIKKHRIDEIEIKQKEKIDG